MKTINFLAILAVVVVFSALTPTLRSAQDANSGPSHAKVANPVKPTPEHQARAKQIYSIDCAMCHGVNGNGKTDLARDMQLNLKDWTEPGTLGNKSDGQIFDIVRQGMDKMPPEAEGRAPDEALWNLVIFIRSNSAAKPVAK
jgi:cytochrome c